MTRREPADRPSAAAVEARLRALDEPAPVTRALTVPVPLAPPASPRPLPARLERVRRDSRPVRWDAVPWDRWRAYAARVPFAVWLVVGVLLAVLLVALMPGGGSSGSAPLPRGVSPSLAPQLQQLHDAVEGR
jgi:hypothetical protein